MTDNNYRSEWNEQMLFAQQYFILTHQCRLAQMSGNAAYWWRALDVKLSQAMGIFPNGVKDKLLVRRIEIIKKQNEAFSYPSNHPARRIVLSELYEKLFEFETMIDTNVNEVMPFLKIDKDISLEEEF